MSDQVQGPPGPRHLEKLLALIKRYVVMTDEQRLVVALWIVHAHMAEHFDQTPYLTVTSPQRQCGKSRLLELLEQLVPRPWLTVTPSEAVIYRRVHLDMPTLLLDEVDAIFAPKTADRYEGLRAIVNSGHRKSATVSRCVGPSHKLAEFNVYCAKVLAGIGTLPDTITDRAIPIRLQRKTRGERVERFRYREAKSETEPIREALAAYAAAHGESMAQLRPELPEELSDRMQEGCEPLIAIADTLGYGDEARAAFVSLLVSDRDDERESVALKLLADVRTLFRLLGDRTMHTESLTASLNANGWGDWYGRGLNAQDLATSFRPYGIRPKNVRVAGHVAKGYHQDDFVVTWERYLPEEVTGASPDDNGTVTPVTPLGESGTGGLDERTFPSSIDGVTGVTTDLLDDFLHGRLSGGARHA